MSFLPLNDWSQQCQCPCCQPRSFTTTSTKWLPEPEPMADEDVERIARRVAELLRDKL